MISLSLGIWLVAVFNFSGQPNTQIQETSDSVFSSFSNIPDLQFSELGNQLEVPSFKVDWSLTGKLNSVLGDFAGLSGKGLLTSSFYKKPVPLFDVKVTFLDFFYPW